MRYFRLNQRGFGHVMIAVASAVGVGLVGTVVLVLTHANPWRGVLEVYSRNSGYCLTATGGSTGSTVVLDPCFKRASNNQVWTLNDIRTAAVLGASNVQEFTLQSAAGSNECLNNWGSSKEAGNAMKLYTCNSGDAASAWGWGAKGYSSHQLVNLASISGSSGLCLDDWGGSNTRGTEVDAVTCKTGSQPNQDWFENGAPSDNSSGSSAGSSSGGCAYNAVVAPCIGSATTGASGWGPPTFDDEFNGSSVDTSKWVVEGPRQPNNPQEYACYSPASVSVSDGYLNLALQNKSCSAGGSTYQYMGAQISTTGLFSQTYGYYEARVYSPGLNGTIFNWGAFWLTGDNWPAGGEVDIFEGFRGTAGWHFMFPNGNIPVWQGGFQQGQDYTGWHIYAVDWEPSYIKYYYDGKLVGTITQGIISSPMHILLTYSTGPLNNVGGPVSVPHTMKVDYVRAWKKN